jgi:hypothetical protein
MWSDKPETQHKGTCLEVLYNQSEDYGSGNTGLKHRVKWDETLEKMKQLSFLFSRLQPLTRANSESHYCGINYRIGFRPDIIQGISMFMGLLDVFMLTLCIRSIPEELQDGNCEELFYFRNTRNLRNCHTFIRLKIKHPPEQLKYFHIFQYFHFPIQWVQGVLSPGVKRPGRETDHSPPASTEVKKMWIYTFTPPYAFTA